MNTYIIYITCNYLCTIVVQSYLTNQTTSLNNINMWVNISTCLHTFSKYIYLPVLICWFFNYFMKLFILFCILLWSVQYKILVNLLTHRKKNPSDAIIKMWFLFLITSSHYFFLIYHRKIITFYYFASSRGWCFV